MLEPGRAATWGPRLLSLYGVGLVAGGVFVADPGAGFPPSVPEGAPEQLSWHGAVHAVAPPLAFLSLVVARRFAAAGERGWAAYSVATALGCLALTTWPDLDGISVRLAVACSSARPGSRPAPSSGSSGRNHEGDEDDRPQPSLDALDALVGEWFLGDPAAPVGRTSFSWLEISPDGSSWARDFELVYTRVGGCVAPDFAIENRLWIRQHPRPARAGGGVSAAGWLAVRRAGLCPGLAPPDRRP